MWNNLPEFIWNDNLLIALWQELISLHRLSFNEHLPVVNLALCIACHNIPVSNVRNTVFNSLGASVHFDLDNNKKLCFFLECSICPIATLYSLSFFIFCCIKHRTKGETKQAELIRVHNGDDITMLCYETIWHQYKPQAHSLPGPARWADGTPQSP